MVLRAVFMWDHPYIDNVSVMDACHIFTQSVLAVIPLIEVMTGVV